MLETNSLLLFQNLSKEAKALAALSTILLGSVGKSDLDHIAKTSKNMEVIQCLKAISSSALKACEEAGFIQYKQGSIKILDFDQRAVFFEALSLDYFKDLCIGYCRFLEQDQSIYTWSWQYKEPFKVFCLRMQLYVFNNLEIEREAVLKRVITKYRLNSKELMRSPKLAQQLFLQDLSLFGLKKIRNPHVRIQLIEEYVLEDFAYGRVSKHLIEYLIDRMHQIQNDRVMQVICQSALRAGLADELKETAIDAPNVMYKSWLLGHYYFSQADFKTALPYLEEGQKLYRKAQKSNKVEFDEIQLMIGFCLLALSAPDLQWKDFWSSIYSNSIKESIEATILQILSKQADVETQQNIDKTSVKNLIQFCSYSNALYFTYLAYWVGRADLAEAILKLPDIQELPEDLKWVKLEFKALGKALKHKEVPEESILSKVFSPLSNWEKILDQIEALATPASPLQNEQAERIIWLVDLEELDIEPKLQKRRKNGDWTKGRNIAFNKLNDPPYQQLMSVQDQQITELLISYYYDHFQSYSYAKQMSEISLEAQILEALAGHPFLFLKHSPETPCQIMQAKLELQLHQTEDGYYFRNPYEGWIVDDAYILKRETATRYIYIGLKKQEVQLLQLLERKKVKIPKSAKGRLEKTVEQLSSSIPIQSDLQIDESQMLEHEYDPRIYVHIIPLGDFFQAELFVKPFGEVPPYFAPAEGTERLITEINRQTQFVKRDLDQEERWADAIIESSEVLSKIPHENGIWTLEEVDDCLQLLAELNMWRKEDRLVLEWPQGEKIRISAFASFDQLFVNMRSSGNWFEMEGELKVDEHQVLKMQDLLTKTQQSQSRFVQLDDGSFLALTSQLQKRLQEINNWTEQKKGKVLLPQVAGLALEQWSHDFLLQGDQGWKDFVLRMEEAQDKSFQLPKGLQAELRPYQKEGYQWLCRMAWWGAGACLADDMGLGKTVQAIALLLKRQNEGPALVVAPASVCSNWISELERFAPDLKAYNLSEAEDRTKRIVALKEADVLVCTYGLMYQSQDDLAEKTFGTIVLDEAQSIKNRLTKRSKAAMRLEAKFRLITTGTPMENHLGELWNLFRFINPGLLGSAKQFRDRFAGPIEKYDDRARREQLQHLIRPFILRRHKRDVLKDLPPKTEITLKVERSEEETAFYEAIRRKALADLQSGAFENEGHRQLKVLGELMRLRRACCHPQLIQSNANVGQAKMDALAELVDELIENGHKALIFSQFVDCLRIIEEIIQQKNIAYQYLDGQTPLKKRKKAVDDFQEGEGDLFLISLKAGGTGLNLTEADFVIHVDPWWNPAVEDQASDRAHRIGQQKPVTVYRLVMANTIEEKIVKLHEQKRSMAEALLMETDGQAKLSAEDLLALLQD
jgi:SNF2 family DNA or RNA helicase